MNALFESWSASQPLAYLLHPGSDERNCLTDPEKAEIPVRLEHPEWIE